MSRFNVQSFLFAFTVLLLTLIGQRSSHEASRVPTIHPIAKTSLAETENLELLDREGESRENVLASVHTALPTHPSLSIQAEGVLVKEIGSYEILYEVNANDAWPLASITKLMTALVAEQLIPPQTVIQISADAIAVPGIAGSLKEGEFYTKENLIRAALGISSNDAASALGEAVGYPAFIDAMRSEAHALHMMNTSFFDVTGLSSLNFGTLYDLSKLAEYIFLNEPHLLEVTRSKSFSIMEEHTHVSHTIVNNNEFAGSPWFLGGKTGYTEDARGNLVSLVRIHDRNFVIAVFGSDDRFGETRKVIDYLQDL